MNYPQPKPNELHDTQFVGENFRSREKSKRRIKTIISKINRLEPHEKTRLFEELQTEFSNRQNQSK